KAKDLAATLNAIYGAKETVPTAQPTAPPTGRPPGSPYQPPPPSPTAAPGAPLGTPGVTDVGFVEGQFRFIADETTNAVIVTTTPRLWADVEPTIRSLDKMPRQVLIEVLVAEITLNDDTRLGIDWALRGSSGSVPFRVAQQSIQTSSPPSITTPTGFEALGAATAIAIKQAVNSVGPAVAPTNSPSFLKREAETSVVLLNNQTLVLGGLIQDKRTITERGLPFLSKIPVLGYLFGFKENQLEKSELILLITPRVVGTPIDAQRITDQMRRATP